MKYCGNLWEGVNEGVYLMCAQLKAIKDTSVTFTINDMLQGCAGKMYWFETSDGVEKSIYHGYVDDMVLNTTLDILSVITHGVWNLQEEKRILIYMNILKRCFYVGRLF